MDMRSAQRWCEICIGAFLLGAIALAGDGAKAAPRVVADEACGYYAIDIESFATCIDGRVARADDESVEQETLFVGS
jgi:hypothetical protein